VAQAATDLYVAQVITDAWASEGFFSRGGPLVDFCRRWSKAFLQGGPTVMKFRFSS